VYTSWRTVTGPNAALSAVTSASLPTLERTAVLETRPSGTPGPPSASTPATFRWNGPAGATVTYDAKRSSVLLARNVFDPHWRARIDGRPATVFPADEVDQGIAVPAGRHTVTLIYDDPSIGIGLLVSLLSLAGLLGTALALRLL